MIKEHFERFEIYELLMLTEQQNPHVDYVIVIARYRLQYGIYFSELRFFVSIFIKKILTRKIFHSVRCFKSDNYFIIRVKNILQPSIKTKGFSQRKLSRFDFKQERGKTDFFKCK